MSKQYSLDVDDSLLEFSNKIGTTVIIVLWIVFLWFGFSVFSSILGTIDLTSM